MIDRIHPVFLIALGGLLGALARYFISGLLKDTGYLPYGTLSVNVLGSIFLEFLFTLHSLNIVESSWLILLGTGFLGSFTTMSTFVVETMSLSNASYNLAMWNFFLTIVLVFAGGFFGRSMAIFYVRGLL